MPNDPNSTAVCCGASTHRRHGTLPIMLAAVSVLLLLSTVDAQAQRPIIYKCTQPDGRTEYSNAPCGPDEQPDYITGKSFSIIDRAGGKQDGRASSSSPPISPRAIDRQRFMQREAERR